MSTKNNLKMQQKKEAAARMRLLRMLPNVITEMRQGTINRSEAGILYWVNDAQKQIIRDFELDNNALVYHVIHNVLRETGGELLTLLYVSAHQTEWEMDRADLAEGYSFAYVVNVDDPLCSDFGSVGVAPRYGGVIRTA